MSRSVRKPPARSGEGQGWDYYLDSVAEAWENLGPKGDRLFPLDGPAARLLYLSLLLSRRSHREFQTELGVSAPVVRLLFHLRRLGPCTLKQLAESTSMDKAQVSRTLAGMVKGGYIGFSGPLERPTRFTARTKAVLAPPGEELLARALVVARPLHLEVLEALEPAEFRMLYKVLSRLIAMAEEWDAAGARTKSPQGAPPKPKRQAANAATRGNSTK